MAARSHARAIKVLQLVSAARTVDDLAAADTALVDGVEGLRITGVDALDALLAATAAAASSALRIIAAQHTPPTSEAGWHTLARALTCACSTISLPLGLEFLATQQPVAGYDEAATNGLMRALTAAANTTAAHLRQPRPPQGGACRAQCAAAFNWLCMGLTLVNAVMPLAVSLERGSVPRWWPSEVPAYLCGLPVLAAAALCSDADVSAQGAAAIADNWARAIAFTVQPVLLRVVRIVDSAQLEDGSLVDGMHAAVSLLVLLRLGLQTAVLYQNRSGRSGIAADPVAAADLTSSSSTRSSGGGGGGGDNTLLLPPLASLLAVPHLHQALLRQVPHAHLMLQQPAVLASLVGRDAGGIFIWKKLSHLKQPALQVVSTNMVPALQLVVELALLQAENHGAVCVAVKAMMDMASAPALCHSSSRGGGGGGGGDKRWQLQPAQAAGLLAPVLHLLSAAVLHVLGTPPVVALGVTPLSAAQTATMAGQFGVLVAAVVDAVEPKHLAAAIGAQPLRSLAALEMTVRLWATGLVPQLSEAGATDGTPPLLHLATNVAEACRIALDSGKLAAALQGSDSAAGLASNHLLALLTSCLKCSMADSSAAAYKAAKHVAVVGQAAVLGAHASVAGRQTASGSGSSSSSSSSSSGQRAITRCDPIHWLYLVGRSLSELSQCMMQSVAAVVLSQARGASRARLGLQEGELQLASAADAAAVIQVAGHAASPPGAATTPQGDSHEAAGQQQVDAAAAVAGGMGLIMLFAGTGKLQLPEMLCSVVPELLQVLEDSLEDSLTQLARTSSGSSRIRPELLHQLAHSAFDVQEQLDAYCRRAAAAVASCIEHAQASGRSEAEGYSNAVQQGADGVCVLRDRRGRPTVKQHALLNMLHHLQRLQQLGAAVCAALPPPSLCCANPACSNVSGLSDMHLVWRRGVCGHCRATRFCSAACLRAAWPTHRDPGSLVEAAVMGGGGA